MRVLSQSFGLCCKGQKDVFSLKETASCHDAAEMMVKGNFGSVPIADREGRLVGMMTEIVAVYLDSASL